MHTEHICIWGAPGTGKSTIAAGLFHEMKMRGYSVELVAEYAKSLVFSKDFFKLKDQLYVFAKQQHPWFKLQGQVEYTVNDSPFLMGALYVQDSEHLPKKELVHLMNTMYKTYKTIDIFLLRNENNKYETTGRNQTSEESYEMQNEIAKFLLFNDIEHIKIVSSDKAVQEILDFINILRIF